MSLFLMGCTSTKQIYHEPKFYEFNLSSVKLEEIEQIDLGRHLSFRSEKHEEVVIPVEIFLKMKSINKKRKVHLKIYKQLYDWALEDVGRYRKFVKKQKKFFKESNKKKQAPSPLLYFF